MGKCIHCGQPAGLFRNIHADCRQLHLSGQTNLYRVVTEAIVNDDSLNFEEQVNGIARSSFMDGNDVKDTIAAGWAAVVDQCLEKGFVSYQEESLLTSFAERNKLVPEVLDRYGGWSRMALGSVIRDIEAGTSPSYTQEWSGELPFNLRRFERLVWLFGEVTFTAERTSTVFEHPGPIDEEYHIHRSTSRYSSASKKLVAFATTFVLLEAAKAIRSRIYPVTRTRLDKLGPGLLGVTTANIYHVGEVRFERVALTKIKSLTPEEDSLRISCTSAEGETTVKLSNIDGALARKLISTLISHPG